MKKNILFGLLIFIILSFMTSCNSSTTNSNNQINFLAVGYNSQTKQAIIAKSHDGRTWENVPNPYRSVMLNKIVCNLNQDVIIGKDLVTQKSVILNSSDENNWNVNFNAILKDGQFFNLSLLNNQFIILGQMLNNGANGLFATSNDGIKWITNFTNIFPTNSTLYDITYGMGKYLVAGGQTFSDHTSQAILFVSNNGTTWTNISNLLPNNLKSVTNIVYGNGIFIAIGINTQDETVILNSTDGVFWAIEENNALASTNLQDIIYANNQFTIVGATQATVETSLPLKTGRNDNDTFPKALILNSKSGTKWDTLSIKVPSNSILSKVVYSSQGYIAIGSNFEDPTRSMSLILISKDGNTWETMNNTPVANLKSICVKS